MSPKLIICLFCVSVAGFPGPVAAGEVLIVAIRGETGDEVLKLDADTLGALASFEKGFWGPIASILALPDGNVAIVERTGRGCPRDRRLQEERIGKASVSRVDVSDFDGFNYRFVGMTARYSGDAAYAADGSLGGIVNQFGEVLLTQNSNQNYDGAELFNGLDPSLPRPYGEHGFEQTGSINPAACGVAGVALANGDWVLAGYEALPPDQYMATLWFRPRTNIMDHVNSMFRTGIKGDAPTAIAVNKNDKIALGVKSGTLRQLSCRELVFTVEATQEPAESAGGTIVALAALSNGDWVVGTGGGRVQILKEGSLTPIAELSNLAPITTLGVRANDDIVIGTTEGQIMIYDRSLKTLKQTADGLGPVTHLAVVPTQCKASRVVKASRAIKNEPKHSAWINALKPRGKPGPQIVLAANGKTDYAIVCPASPTTQEEKAAIDLAHWLGEITGANFPVLKEEPADERHYTILGIGKKVRVGISPAHFISIGQTRLLAQAGLTKKNSDLSAEGYTIGVKDRNLYLVGGTKRGPINAAYALLEEDLGCRWYAAGTATLPYSSRLRFKPVPRTYRPALIDRRDPYYTEAQDVDWSLRNRTLGIGIPIPPAWGGYPKPLGLTGYVHSMPNIIPPSEFFDKHPEYFMVENGRRTPNQLCLTDPDVLRIAIERIKAGLAAEPDARIVDVSPRDGGGICQCDNCQAINTREESGMGSLLTFVNGVADAIRDEHPDVRVTTLAYLDTILPPKTLRPRDNVLIWLCTDSHAWEHLLQFVWETEPEENQTPGHVDVFDKALRGWHAIGAKMVIWDYPIDYHNYILPLPNMPVVTENMRYYVKHGATGIFQQAQHNQTYGVDRSLMRSWVWAKQMWDLSRETKALVRDFNHGFYGKAAEPMQKYDDLLWATWERLHKDLPELRRLERKYGPGVFEAVLTPEFIDRSHRLMLEAEHLAEGDETLTARVKLAKLPILYVLCRRGRGQQDLQDYVKLMDEFEAIAKANNAVNIESGLRGPFRDEIVAQWRSKATQ